MARKSRKNIVVTNEPEIKTAIYIRTAQYIRLSVEDSSNKGNSIENQKLILDDFIAQHPDMQCVGVYIDNGTTGTNYNRPEFQKLTADIEAGKIDCVVVKDLSRLGRNSIDTGFYIERYFPEHKIRFIAFFFLSLESFFNCFQQLRIFCKCRILRIFFNNAFY